MRRRNIPHRKISIHALCEEGDSFSFSNRPVFSSFLSTPSARRATHPQGRDDPRQKDFYPRPLRGGRRGSRWACSSSLPISIHALCEEGDLLCQVLRHNVRISIHALCEEGDNYSPEAALHEIEFLSTPSARRATVPCDSVCQTIEDFYPRPLRGGRRSRAAVRRSSSRISIHALCEEGDLPHLVNVLVVDISIHALCEEGDGDPGGPAPVRYRFLSTPSARRATGGGGGPGGGVDISIHALCEEGDATASTVPLCSHRFLSTPSARRATGRAADRVPRERISIHALCEEGDYPKEVSTISRRKFLSTPSARRATLLILEITQLMAISIHALCEEGDSQGPNKGPPE